MIDKFTRLLVLFFIMGSIYYMIEILFDGSSHWTMAVCGGICGMVGGWINEYKRNISVWKQCVLITTIILLLEYAIGYVVNIRLKLEVWNYNNMPLNLNGQICFTYALIWFFVFSPIIIWLDDWLRWRLFDEKIPDKLRYVYYKLFNGK